MDIISQILEWIQDFWNQASVWVPITSVSIFAIGSKILKTILSIVNSKKKQFEVDKFLQDLKIELENEKKKLESSLETIQKYRKIIEELINTQINPAIKEKLFSLVNEIKELESIDETKKLNNLKENIEEVAEQIDKSEESSSVMFTGD